MSDDINHSMDQRLRRLAKERRAAAPTVGLHPVNRRLLQDEVRRVHGGAAEPSKPRLHGWMLWGPRLSWGASVAAFVALVALMVNVPSPGTREDQPAAPSSGDRAPSTPAAGQAGVASTKLDSLAPVPPPSVAASRPSTLVPAPASIPPPAPAPQAPPAGPTLAKRYGLRATNTVKPAATSMAHADTASVAATVSSPPPTVSEPTPSGTVTALAMKAKAETDAFVQANPNATANAPAQNFRFQQVPVRPDRRRNFQSPQPPNVLQSFELIQNGSQVRLVDADGSVYEGEWSEASPSGQAQGGLNREAKVGQGTDRAEPMPAKAAAPGQRDLSSVAADAAAAPTQAVAAYSNSIRASGLNRTLNQQVEFAGVLTVTNGVLSPGAMGGAQVPLALSQNLGSNAAAQLQQQSTQSQMLQQGQAVLQGRVVIGRSNRFDLQAVPAKP
jgi:hypothetical protein